jgi:hypothetical protein
VGWCNRRTASHSPLSRTEVKNTWRSTPSMTLLVKHSNTFSFDVTNYYIQDCLLSHSFLFLPISLFSSFRLHFLRNTYYYSNHMRRDMGRHTSQLTPSSRLLFGNTKVARLIKNYAGFEGTRQTVKILNTFCDRCGHQRDTIVSKLFLSLAISYNLSTSEYAGDCTVSATFARDSPLV